MGELVAPVVRHHDVLGAGRGYAEKSEWDLLLKMIQVYIWLVVEPTPLKNMKVNWDDDIPNIWKKNKCSKPPTSKSFFRSSSILVGATTLRPDTGSRPNRQNQTSWQLGRSSEGLLSGSLRSSVSCELAAEW